MSSDLELFDKFIAHDDFVDFMCELMPLLHNGRAMKDTSFVGRLKWLKTTDVDEYQDYCKKQKWSCRTGVDILITFKKKMEDVKSPFKTKFDSLLDELELRDLSKKQGDLNTQSQALAKQIEELAAKKRKRI